MAPRPDPDPGVAVRSQVLANAFSEFSSRAGHDLVSPLNQAASLVALFVQRYKNQLDSEADVLLEFLQSSAGRMRGVVAGVQEYLEIASGLPEISDADLNACLAAAQAKLEGAIAQNSVEIVSEPLPVIRADRRQMARVFEILLDNAIKFRRPDEPSLICITGGSADGRQIIGVADNGIGIDANYREAVLLPFRRLHGKEYPGAGLGLAIVKLIVELNGGTTRIESSSCAESGSGASVVMTFPHPAVESAAP
jgi:light-regulated signal transduction histidine kinase (bacteriophytochrome)